MVRAYAKAIDLLIRQRGMKDDEVFRRLTEHLRATGRMKLLPQLLSELRRLEKRNAAHLPVLEAATEKERGEAEAAAKEVGVSTRAVINPDLVTGWRLVGANILIDRSGKRALLDLYRAITL